MAEAKFAVVMVYVPFHVRHLHRLPAPVVRWVVARGWADFWVDGERQTPTLGEVTS